MKVIPSEAKELIMDALMAQLVPFIGGSPGISKSALIREIADENNLQLIDFRLAQADPVDLNGFPNIEGNKSTFLPPKIFPIEGDPIPAGKAGWLLFLDEINSAPLAVQTASYKLILDKMIGEHHLHKNVAIVAAGNLSTDKAITNRIGTAMQSRLIHLELEVSHKDWINWAINNGIDHRITGFLEFRPELLHNFNPNHDDNTFCCPRTWHFLSKIINSWETIPTNKLPILAGTVGEGAAYEFHTYSQIYERLPTIEKIKENPEAINLDIEPSDLYAISSLLSEHMDKSGIKQLIKLVNRLPMEFQVTTLQTSIKKHPEIRTHEEIMKWIKLNSSELF